MIGFLLSGLAGLAVGVAYGLIRVDAPAPPLAALFGLLGMLAGQALVRLLRAQWAG